MELWGLLGPWLPVQSAFKYYVLAAQAPLQLQLLLCLPDKWPQRKEGAQRSFSFPEGTWNRTACLSDRPASSRLESRRQAWGSFRNGELLVSCSRPSGTHGLDPSPPLPLACSVSSLLGHLDPGLPPHLPCRPRLRSQSACWLLPPRLPSTHGQTSNSAPRPEGTTFLVSGFNGTTSICPSSASFSILLSGHSKMMLFSCSLVTNILPPLAPRTQGGLLCPERRPRPALQEQCRSFVTEPGSHCVCDHPSRPCTSHSTPGLGLG